jgi:hypothetical protein
MSVLCCRRAPGLAKLAFSCALQATVTAVSIDAHGGAPCTAGVMSVCYDERVRAIILLSVEQSRKCYRDAVAPSIL